MSNLAEFSDRVTLIHSSYQEMVSHLNNRNWHTVDGILYDVYLDTKDSLMELVSNIWFPSFISFTLLIDDIMFSRQ